MEDRIEGWSSPISNSPSAADSVVVAAVPPEVRALVTMTAASSSTARVSALLRPALGAGVSNERSIPYVQHVGRGRSRGLAVRGGLN